MGSISAKDHGFPHSLTKETEAFIFTHTVKARKNSDVVSTLSLQHSFYKRFLKRASAMCKKGKGSCEVMKEKRQTTGLRIKVLYASEGGEENEMGKRLF